MSINYENVSEHYENNFSDERIGNWMQTYTGKMFWPLDPRVEEIDIEDIAHSLSMQCRYAGHCPNFYSVAEHSIHVSKVVPVEFALIGLLHDATETYCIDVPRPLKPYLTGYTDIENNIWKCISEKYNLLANIPKVVKEADNAVLLTEKNQLIVKEAAPWNISGAPANVSIQCWPPEVAKLLFLERFEELINVAR
jgi:uncharacterized protein